MKVAILSKPTKKEAEEGQTESLVFGPKAIVARDPQGAAIAAVLSGDGSGNALKIDMNKAEVLVRPFAGGSFRISIGFFHFFQNVITTANRLPVQELMNNLGGTATPEEIATAPQWLRKLEGYE